MDLSRQGRETGRHEDGGLNGTIGMKKAFNVLGNITAGLKYMLAEICR